MDIKTICLGVLSLGEASGYEIKKMFEEGPFSHFYDAGYGSIYPALGGLLAGGFATCREVEQDGRPAKKIYTITDAGLDALREALHRPPGKDRVRSDALVAMYFGYLLEGGQKHRVFEDYLNHYRQALAALKELDMENVHDERRFVHGLGVAIYEAAVGYLEEHGDAFLDTAGEAEAPPRWAVGGAE